MRSDYGTMKIAIYPGSFDPEIQIDGIDLGNEFVPHGAQKKLYEYCGLDEQSIADFTKEMLSHED